MLGLYGVVSMAYSHPIIRLKKYAWTSLVIAGLFQGYFTFAMAYAGLSNLGWEVLSKPHVILPGLLTSLMLWGNYPLTQVYQHGEDARRGDRTLSLLLGIKGTFAFSTLFFVLRLLLLSGILWIKGNRQSQDTTWQQWHLLPYFS